MSQWPADLMARPRLHPAGAVVAGRSMTKNASTPPLATTTPEITIASAKPRANTSASLYASPVNPTSTGNTATASNCADRATALLTPDATPECRSSWFASDFVTQMG